MDADDAQADNDEPGEEEADRWRAERLRREAARDVLARSGVTPMTINSLTHRALWRPWPPGGYREPPDWRYLDPDWLAGATDEELADVRGLGPVGRRSLRAALAAAGYDGSGAWEACPCCGGSGRRRNDGHP